MKRILKITLCLLAIAFMVSPTGLALRSNIDEYAQEFDVQGIFDSIDGETKKILEEIGITEISYNSVFSVEPQKVFDALFNIVSDALRKPIKFMLVAIGVLMITSTLTSFTDNGESVRIVGGGVLSLTIAVPVATVVTTAFAVLEALLVFTTAFTGVFSVIVSTSGNVTMGVSYAALTVFSDTVFSGLLVNIAQPVVNVMCSVGFLSCFDVYNFTERISSIIKKVYVFALSFVGTVFSGLVTLKGVLSNGVDTLSSRSIRFVIGQSLPIVGGAVSETYSTLVSSLGLIKNTVGAFGIITVIVFVLPTLTELFMWLLSLEAVFSASQIFGVKNSLCMLSVIKDAMILLVSTIVILTTIFIVSVGVCIAVKGGAV